MILQMVELLRDSLKSLNLQAIEVELVQSLGILVALGLLRWMVLLFVNHETQDAQIRYWWRKGTAYLAVILAVLLVGRIWLGQTQATATFLGLVSAGLAIALQGPITDFAGWLFILIRRPFEVGDRIEIGNFAGDVIDIRLFQFSLLEIGNWVHADQSTGRILDVPNRKIFSEVLANYTQGFQYIWHEIPVLITFESDWERAKIVLQDITDQHCRGITQTVAEQMKRASRRFLIKYSRLTPIVYTKVDANGVLLTIRYLCEVRRRRATEQELWEAILRAFAQEPNLDFAYPTQRFYYNQSDGQPPFNFDPNVKPVSIVEDRHQ